MHERDVETVRTDSGGVRWPLPACLEVCLSIPPEAFPSTDWLSSTGKGRLCYGRVAFDVLGKVHHVWGGQVCNHLVVVQYASYCVNAWLFWGGWREAEFCCSFAWPRSPEEHQRRAFNVIRLGLELAFL